MDVMQRRRVLLMQEVVKYMRLVRTYTVQESWENDTLGSSQAVYDLLLKDIVEASAEFNTAIAVAENNNASRYAINCIIATGNQSGLSTTGAGFYRDNRSTLRGIGSGQSAWATVGTVFKIYSVF